MQIELKIKEQEQSSVGYSLNLPVVFTRGLMGELINLGYDASKVVMESYRRLREEYSNKNMDYLQVLQLLNPSGECILEFWAISNAEVGTDTSEAEYGDYNLTFLLPSEY